MNGNYGWQAESGDMGYARLSPVIGDMAIDKGRFSFGRNWQRFLRVLDEERIREAEKSLCEMLRVSDLSGRSFLDVGCGSGIFSLAAMRLGASRVHSFDYDPESVACAHELKSRFFRSVARWTIERGDALDKNYLASLGTYDVVYSWGVLHHTGNLWQAMDNVLPRVADAGKLFLAIYNDAGKKSRRWCRLKKLYNSGALFRVTLLSVFIPLNVARRVVVDLSNLKNPVLRYRTYKKQRGMSMLRDWIDWIGGWPYEFATVEQVVEFCTSRGFGLLMHGNKSGWVLGNNEFVFERQRGVGVRAQ